MRPRAARGWLLGWLLAATLGAQAPRTCLVLRFENRTEDATLDWIGESFFDSFSDQLAPEVALVGREQRRQLLLDAGVPPDSTISHATALRLADSVDADCLISGEYRYTGAGIEATGELFDLGAERLTRLEDAPGPLRDLEAIERRLASEARAVLAPEGAAPAAAPAMPLPAYENYVRAMLAEGAPERLRYLVAASGLAPNDPRVMFALGRTYFIVDRDYTDALLWLPRLPPGDANWIEAQFLSGLAAYRLGQYSRAAAFDRVLAARLPLPQVLNNWALADAHLAGAANRAAAAELLQKAVAQDAGDGDLAANLRLVQAVAAQTPGAGAALAQSAALKTELPAQEFGALAGVVAAFDAGKANQLPRMAHVQFSLDEGQRLLRQGALDAAAAQFQSALELLADPPAPASDLAAAHAGLGQVELARQDWDRALAEAGQSLVSQPSAAAYLVRAQVELVRRQTVSAQRDVAAALRLAPHDPEGLALQSQLRAHR